MGQTDVHSLMKLFLSTSVLIQLTANILFVNTFLLQASNHHSHLDTNVEVDPHIGSAPVSRLLVELWAPLSPLTSTAAPLSLSSHFNGFCVSSCKVIFVSVCVCLTNLYNTLKMM